MEENRISIPEDRSDISVEIGSDAEQPNSNIATESLSKTKEPSSDIPRTTTEIMAEENIPIGEKVRLRKAALEGDWQAAESILHTYPHAVRVGITGDRETILHIAVATKQTAFTEKVMERMTGTDLTLKTANGSTAFLYAAISGNMDSAKKMMEMNVTLPSISNDFDFLPIYYAIVHRKRRLVSYLLTVTPLKASDSPGGGINALTAAITVAMYDVALEILTKDPSLATAEDLFGRTALECLAEKSGAIGSTSELSSRKRYLNSRFKWAYNQDLMQTMAHQLVECLWRQIEELPEKQFMDQVPKLLPIVHSAGKVGNVGFLTIILHSCPDLTWKQSKDGLNLFDVAILNRQESVISLIYELCPANDLIATTFDANYNGALHHAAQLAPQHRLKAIPGASFKMDQELLWFKEIEAMIPPGYAKLKNSDGLTPHALFIKTHKELQKDEEKWMRDVAKNSTIIATLIATVSFAATITIPGGNNQDNGTPIFFRSDLFLIFFTLNAIALMFSSTSILIFFTVLISRYRIGGSMVSLPRRLQFGLVILTISLLAMIISFCSTCFLVYQSRTISIPAAITALAAIPVILFIELQQNLLIYVTHPSYGSRSLLRMEDTEFKNSSMEKEGEERELNKSRL